jgi:hypothetical protein
MKVFTVKFGETNSGTYSDDTKIAAESILEASVKADKISRKRYADSLADFEPENDGLTEQEQRAQWANDAKTSFEVTSIIFDSDLEEEDP